MDDDFDVVRSLLPGDDLEVLAELGGSRRSTVHRVRTGTRTVIVKRFLVTDEWDGWARERAALSVLPPGVRAPRLLAAAQSTLVMSDLGAGRNVADLLLGDDPVAAAEGVEQWATAIATLHRRTIGSREAFREALGTVAESRLDIDLAEAAEFLEQRYGVDVAQDLRGLGRLAGPAALTPADACPDNNLFTGDGLALIDFEGAQWRHILWDVAYLTAPWPTCWCAWRMPDDVVARAIGAYRLALADPYAKKPDFDADLAAVTAAWSLMSATWVLPRVLSDEPGPARPGMPNLRDMIMHAVRTARAQTTLPALAEVAARMHDDLAGRWGESELPYAPAFAKA